MALRGHRSAERNRRSVARPPSPVFRVLVLWGTRDGANLRRPERVNSLYANVASETVRLKRVEKAVWEDGRGCTLHPPARTYFMAYFWVLPVPGALPAVTQPGADWEDLLSSCWAELLRRNCGRRGRGKITFILSICRFAPAVQGILRAHRAPLQGNVMDLVVHNGPIRALALGWGDTCLVTGSPSRAPGLSLFRSLARCSLRRM